MRKRVLFIFFLFLIPILVFSGDIATFQNLGFSPDSRYFMFGEHGIDEKNSTPYAEIFIVDVSANRFVPDGTKQVTYSRSVDPGHDSRGALFNLLEDALPYKRKYRIDHIRTGRLLYILIDGEQPKGRLEFRDFQTGIKYHLNLVQSAKGSGENISSAFHILLTVKKPSARLYNYIVGLPDYRRKGVERYRIKQVVLAPDEISMILVIEKEETNTAGADIRYMVEAIKLLP